jgi:hypothetical protein
MLVCGYTSYHEARLSSAITWVMSCLQHDGHHHMHINTLTGLSHHHGLSGQRTVGPADV